MTDDALLRLVTPEKEDFPYAEERRLLYVALTRAKKKVLVLIPDEPEFGFAAELLEILGMPTSHAAACADLCPHCKRGELRVRNGPYGKFLSCSKYPACAFKQKIRVALRPAFAG